MFYDRVVVSMCIEVDTENTEVISDFPPGHSSILLPKSYDQPLNPGLQLAMFT